MSLDVFRSRLGIEISSFIILLSKNEYESIFHTNDSWTFSGITSSCQVCFEDQCRSTNTETVETSKAIQNWSASIIGPGCRSKSLNFSLFKFDLLL